jgi:hypothetical protein
MQGNEIHVGSLRRCPKWLRIVDNTTTLEHYN